MIYIPRNLLRFKFSRDHWRINSILSYSAFFNSKLTVFHDKCVRTLGNNHVRQRWSLGWCIIWHYYTTIIQRWKWSLRSNLLVDSITSEIRPEILILWAASLLSCPSLLPLQKFWQFISCVQRDSAATRNNTRRSFVSAFRSRMKNRAEASPRSRWIRQILAIKPKLRLAENVSHPLTLALFFCPPFLQQAENWTAIPEDTEVPRSRRANWHGAFAAKWTNFRSSGTL